MESNGMIKNTLLLVAINLIFSGSVFAAHSAKTKCFGVGDIITVKGKVNGFINGGTYLELDKAICVNYPDASNIRTESHLSTLGKKLPPSTYLKITGVLHDGHDRGIVGFDIDTIQYEDIDAEMKAEIANKELQCKEWQAANSEALSRKAHGGTANPFAGNPNEKHSCGLWAIDSQAPHHQFSIWRSESK